MLKDKEIAVFNYIKARLSDGMSPSVREIMDAMGFKSTSTAHRYIETLVREGLIEKTGNLNRTLRLPNSGTTSVPVMGTVTAGQPITAVEDITVTVEQCGLGSHVVTVDPDLDLIIESGLFGLVPVVLILDQDGVGILYDLLDDIRTCSYRMLETPVCTMLVESLL